MDLKKAWNELEEQKFSNYKTNKDMIATAIQKESISTINKLRKNLKAKINWVIFFLVLFTGFSIYHFNKPAVLFCMFLLSLSYATGGWAMWTQYKKMGTTKLIGEGSLQIMKSNLQNIKGALKAEAIFGLITLPGAIILAVVISETLRGGTTQDIINQLTSIDKLVYYIILIVFGGLASYFMNEYVYRGDIKILEDQISRLEDLNNN